MNNSDIFDNETVKGVTYEDRQSVIRSLHAGDQILLRREPSNRYNGNAIRVETLDGRQVGYMRDELANMLASRLDSYGVPVPAVVQAILGGPPTGSSYGVRMRFELPVAAGDVRPIAKDPLPERSTHDLTDEQWRIIRHPLNNHARVMAVAGSGKTTTMVYRIKHLVENCHVQPSQICVLMFNARAREQFKTKLDEIIEQPELRPHMVHTFHSFSYSVIKSAAQAGLSISEDEEWIEDKAEVSYIWMRRAINALEQAGVIQKDIITIDDAADCIGLWKGALIPPVRAGHRTIPAMEKVYAEYEKLRKKENGFTYDDYVPEAVKILEVDNELARRYRNRFRVVIVDEYQDVNYGQERLIEFLVGNHADLMVVGDDDQTIYEWRGARPDYLSRRFGIQFSNLPTLFYELTNTFRFGPILAQCAHNVIVNNHTRVSKSLVARRAEQDTAVIIVNNTSEQPTDVDKELANAVHKLIQQGVSPRQIVVLGRLYSQFAGLEAEFLKQKIAYRVHGRKPFLERTEVQALLAYLRLAVHYNEPITDKSLEWLALAANRPNRLIRKDAFATVARAKPAATVAQIMATTAQDKWESPLNAEERARARAFQDVVSGLHERMYDDDIVPAGKLLRWLVNITDYLKHFDNFFGDGLSSTERKDAASALVRFAEDNGQATDAFLSYLERLKPSQGKPLEQQVMMTSIFKVKGEEFDYVLMPGCTEGSIPCAHFTANPIYDKENRVTEPPPSIHIENERRLFYVGITRARKAVLLSTTTAPSYGQQDAAGITLESRFLDEMQYAVTCEVMRELQRCALSSFSDLTSLSAVAEKHAGAGQIVQSLMEGYLARRNLSLPAEVCNRIAATPRVPFAYRHSYSIGAAVKPASTNQPQVPNKRSW